MPVRVNPENFWHKENDRLKKVDEQAKEEQVRIWEVEDERKELSKKNKVLQRQIDVEINSQQEKKKERSETENKLKEQFKRLSRAEKNLEKKNSDIIAAMKKKDCSGVKE